jgi:hypothetical protein
MKFSAADLVDRVLRSPGDVVVVDGLAFARKADGVHPPSELFYVDHWFPTSFSPYSAHLKLSPGQALSLGNVPSTAGA